MADPFAFLNQLDQFGGGAQQPTARFPPLSPEEEDSLLRKVLAATMGPLQYVGETLDKPGRAARGLLAGKPAELANLIPFSDMLGITDDDGPLAGTPLQVTDRSQSVSGRDLLEQYGALAPNQEGLDWGDVGGFAAEVALDPLTYLGVGALTQAGRTAAKTGSVTRGVGKSIGAGERSLLSVGLPFTDGLELAGPGVAKFAEDYVDPALDYLSYGNPIGRNLGRLFDPPRGNMGHGGMQKLHKEEFVPGLAENIIDSTLPLQQDARSFAKAGMLDEDHVRVMRAVGESVDDPNNYTGTLRQAADMGVKLRKLTQGMVDEVRAGGVNIGELQDKMVNYLARSHQPEEWPGVVKELVKSIKQKSDFFNSNRLDFIKGFPLGTNHVNDLINDPDVWNLPFEDAVAKVVNEGIMPQSDKLVDAEHQGKLFVEWVRNLDQQKYMVEKAKFFNTDPITDTIIRTERHQKQLTAMNLLHEGAKRFAIDSTKQAIKPTDVLLTRALRDGGLTYNKIRTRGGVPVEVIGAKATAARNLGLDPLDIVTTKKLFQGKMRSVRSIRGLDNFYVPQEVAADMARYFKYWEEPAELAPILDGVDKLQNLWKATSTQMWPSFHSRNALGAVFYQFVSGADTNPLRFAENLGDAYKVITGGDVPTLPGQMTTDNFVAELQATGTLKAGHNQMQEMIPGTHVASGVPLQPTGAIAGIAGALGDAASQVSSATGIGGKMVAGADAVFNLGRKAGNFTEDLMRVTHYLAQRRNGMDPQAAADSVKKWLFDYCVDESTECLTQRGWLKHDEVRVGDMALTLNPTTLQAEWSSVEAVNVFDSPGTMNHWKSNRIDAMTTDNHRWLVSGSGVRGGRPEDWAAGAHFKTTAELDGTYAHLVVAGSAVAGAEHAKLDDDMVELIGWIISEGQFCKDGSIKISQSEKHNPHHVDRIRSILENYSTSVRGCAIREYSRNVGWGNIVTFHIGHAIALFIRQLIPDKQLPPALLCILTASQLELLFDTLIKGDGHVISRNNTVTWTQKCDGRMDAFHMLCAMLGRRVGTRLCGARTTVRTATVYQSNSVYIESLKKEKVPYEGKAWCPTTSNGTWMARRNGYTYFTGNSELTEFERKAMRRVFPFYKFARANAELVLGDLMKKPGGKMAQSIRAANSPRQDEGFIPPYMGEGAAIPLGDGRFISQLGLPFENAFDPLSIGPGIGKTIERTAQGMVGQMNPALKLSFELATGIEPFSGRELEDLYPYPTEDTLSNTVLNAFGGTPISRVRTATDERKSAPVKVANLFTGVKITDVVGGMERQEELAGRKALAELMKAEPHIDEFTRSYVRPEQMEHLSPEEVAYLRLQETQLRKARAKKKADRATSAR